MYRAEEGGLKLTDLFKFHLIFTGKWNSIFQNFPQKGVTHKVYSELFTFDLLQEFSVKRFTV